VSEGETVKRSKLRRALKAAELAVMGLAALAVLGAVAFFTVPRLLGWQGVIVLTGSMEPALNVGGLAFVDKGIGASEIEEGDIITFNAPDGTYQITHRVVAVKNGAGGPWFETRGDANDENDLDPVPASRVVGRVVMHVPEVGNFSNWIRREENFYLLLLGPAGMVIAGELASIYRELRNKKGLRGQEEAAS
jgi:signal peptidase